MTVKPDTVVRTYHADKNTDGRGQPVASFPGVPLRDLTKAEWDEFPVWIRAGVDASAFFSVVPGTVAATKRPEDAEEETPAQEAAPVTPTRSKRVSGDEASSGE